MWRLGLRNASAHLGRLLLTALAVVLGVTFVAGSLVLTHTSQRVLDQQFRTAASGTDLAVRRAVAFDAAMGVEVTRDPVPPSAVQKIRGVPGVAQVQPVVRGQGLLTVDGRPVVPSGPSLLESWSPAPFNPYPLRSGRAPPRTTRSFSTSPPPSSTRSGSAARSASRGCRRAASVSSASPASGTAPGRRTPPSPWCGCPQPSAS